MSAKVFGEFLSRQGYRVIETESCYWYNAHPGFYFYFPYHRLVNPSKYELTKLFQGERCIGLRFFSPSNSIGKESYLIVCSDKYYDISSVDAACARRQTRRGLERFEIRQVNFNILASQGIQAIYDTLIRQRRSPEIWSEKRWRLYCSSAEGLDGFEAWGAFLKGELVGFIIAYQMEEYFTILHHSSVTRYLRLYPNNALIFYVTKQKLNSAAAEHVFYGPESLDAPQSLVEFKLRMGFQKSPMKQRIVFNPLIQPIINYASHKLVQKIAALKPQSDTLRKIEGVIRFYRESNR